MQATQRVPQPRSARALPAGTHASRSSAVVRAQQGGGAPSAPPASPGPAGRPAPGGAQRRPMPPRPAGPPVMLGPDGKPLQVVQVEKVTEEAWAGVAMVDRGENDEPTNWGRVGTLAAGDVAALALFAAIGRASHHEPLLSAGTLETAAPFIIGWLAAGSLLGGYGRTATGGRVGPAAATAAKCWAVATPLGLALRGISKGYVPPTPFIVVSCVATAVLMLGWRSAYAAITPEDKQLSAAAKAAQRRDRKGNPFEFLELLTSLVKRW